MHENVSQIWDRSKKIKHKLLWLAKKAKVATKLIICYCVFAKKMYLNTALLSARHCLTDTLTDRHETNKRRKLKTQLKMEIS